MIVERRWSVPSPQNSPAPALVCPHRLCQRSIGTDAVKLRKFARDCVHITRCVHNLPDGTIEFTDVSPVTEGVESRCGAVALGRTYLLPPLSSGGALVVPPWLRFHIPLIEPDRQISRIRLSDKTSRFRVQRHLQLLNIYWS